MSTAIHSLVAACKSKACAPPPVGTGGSTSSASVGEVEEITNSSDWNRSYASRDKRLSKDEFEAINAYMTDATYFNRLLRHGPDISVDREDPTLRLPDSPLTDKYYEYRVRQLEKARGLLPHMRSAFEKTAVTIDEPIDLYRGMSFQTESRLGVIRMLGLRPGAEFTDNGFVSTSFEPTDGRNFAEVGLPDVRTSVIIRIRANRGTRVMAGSESESELILPPGSRFRVTDVRMGDVKGNGNSVLEVDVETIP